MGNIETDRPNQNPYEVNMADSNHKETWRETHGIRVETAGDPNKGSLNGVLIRVSRSAAQKDTYTDYVLTIFVRKNSHREKSHICKELACSDDDYNERPLNQ